VIDLETQLRDCLTRHAEHAETPLGLLSSTRARSRQLSRRRNTVAVASVVPVTAAVVLGAAAVSGSFAGGSGGRVQPGTSTSPSASPSIEPTTTTAQPACAGGTVPNVALTSNDQQSWPVTPHTVTVNLPVLTGLTHRIHAVVSFSQLTPSQFMVSGAAPATDQDLLAVVVRNKDHSLSRLWFSEQRGASTTTTDDATFLGCVTAPSPS
jgi:hypothetical protein